MCQAAHKPCSRVTRYLGSKIVPTSCVGELRLRDVNSSLVIASEYYSPDSGLSSMP